MKKISSSKNLLLLYACIAVNCCFSQQKNNNSNTDTLFTKGLYLENFKNWLPWDVTFDSLYAMYKDKNIKKIPTRNSRYGLVMTDVTIFNSVHVDSIWLFAQRPTSKVFYLNVFFTENAADSAKEYLKAYAKENGIIYSLSMPTHNFFNCFISGCIIGVRVHAKWGPHMIIENKKKSVNQWERGEKKANLRKDQARFLGKV